MKPSRFEPLNLVTTSATDLVHDCGTILPLPKGEGRGEGEGESIIPVGSYRQNAAQWFSLYWVRADVPPTFFALRFMERGAGLVNAKTIIRIGVEIFGGFFLLPNALHLAPWCEVRTRRVIGTIL